MKRELKELEVPELPPSLLFRAAVGVEENPVAQSFLEALNLYPHRGRFFEFLDRLEERLREILGEMRFVTPESLQSRFVERGFSLSRQSAINLMKLAEEVGVLFCPREDFCTRTLDDALLFILKERKEVTLQDLRLDYSKFRGSEIEKALLRLWTRGLVEIEGRWGKLDLPRELVLKHGFEYDESVIERWGLKGHPRLEKFVERETGKLKYAILLWGDDRVRLANRRW